MRLPIKSTLQADPEPTDSGSAGPVTEVQPRLELAILGAFSGAWALAVLLGLGVLPAAGALALDLYGYYSFAAALGWVAGNVYVARRRRLGHGARKRLLFAYFLGPPSLLYVVRSLAPLSAQQAAPFVPIYAFCVFGIFFLVPVTLRKVGT